MCALVTGVQTWLFRSAIPAQSANPAADSLENTYRRDEGHRQRPPRWPPRPCISCKNWFCLAVAPETFVHRKRESTPWPSTCRSEEHTSELQSLMRISYAVFCLKKKKKKS